MPDGGVNTQEHEAFRDQVRRFEQPDDAHRHRPISGVISRLMQIFDYLGREETDRLIEAIEDN